MIVTTATINHTFMMKDRRMLRSIRRYLRSGIMEDGLVTPREKGTPQDGPFSPLLSNILLDDLDKELEKRGHPFCRYADDCNIYVGSQRAGQRVLAALTTFLGGRETQADSQSEEERSSMLQNLEAQGRALNTTWTFRAEEMKKVIYPSYGNRYRNFKSPVL